MKKIFLLASIVFLGYFAQSQAITDTYDVSTLPADTLRQGIRLPLQVGWSLLFQAESLTGTLDGEVYIYYSNNGTDTVQVSHASLPFVLNSANANFSIEKSTINYNYLHYRIVKNNLSGGTITVNLARKEY